MVQEGDPRWRAALDVLGRLGTRDATPEVVREGLSLLVRQGDVVVRVRRRSEEPIAAREVEVARVLAEAEVPCAALVVGQKQPWVVEGCAVTAWAWVDTLGPASPADLGLLARDLRERTAGTYSYDVPRLDPLTAIRNAVAAVPLGDEQGDFVRGRAHELTSAWAAVADRDPAGTAIVHGDLHTDNVLRSAAGPLLTDLELAGAGPCAYDTAPAVVAVERYGEPESTLHEFLDAQEHDPRGWDGFETCLSVYELWVTAWAVGVRDRSDELAAEAATRVRCLRDDTCEPWRLR